MKGGAKGPGKCYFLNLMLFKLIKIILKHLIESLNFHYSLGIFFILPCIDAYARVDLRTRTYDVPPQELSIILDLYYINIIQYFPKNLFTFNIH